MTGSMRSGNIGCIAYDLDDSCQGCQAEKDLMDNRCMTVISYSTEYKSAGQYQMGVKIINEIF